MEISTGRKLTEEDDKKILDLYVNKNLSSVQIGRILGTSHRSVLNHLESMGVDRRTLSESHFAYHNKEIPHEFCDYNSMYELYVNNHMTKEQLGTKFNCAPHVIDRVLRTLGIEVRGASAAKIGVQRGEKHHNWKGGTSSLYSLCREYFQTNIAPIIRKRDQYTCQLCGCHSNLHVHHIKYFSDILDEIISEYPHYNVQDNKQELYNIIVNDKRFLDENNLITVCKNCHLYNIHGYNQTIRSEASKN